MRIALEESQADASQVASWDMHATATPGDFNEVEMVRSLMPAETLVTAGTCSGISPCSASADWRLT